MNLIVESFKGHFVLSPIDEKCTEITVLGFNFGTINEGIGLAMIRL